MTVLTKGEASGGSVILVLRDRAGLTTVLSRTNLGDGRSEWREIVGNLPERDPKLLETLEKQRRYDPDLWVVELDIADPAQFIADLPSLS